MRVHWIWFAHRPGLTDRMKNVLMTHFADPEEIYYADPNAFDHISGLSTEGKAALLDKNVEGAEKILRDCEREKLGILTFRDAAYPVGLKNIPDPPMVIYYKGMLPDFDANPVIAVVGTRQASAYGLNAAKRMGYQIARCGGILVSGMAHGIDALAMSGALTAGGKAVGVLGCGADIVYPLSNRSLFRDVEQYGCILSEFAPGTPPMGRNFPRRNRIISGLSNGVLVVEAPEKSGALITARLAAEQGRDVFAVPGNIDQPGFVGSNRLLKDGAIMAASGWDVLCEYQGQYPDKVHRDTAPAQTNGLPAEQEPEKPAPKVAQKPVLPKKNPARKEKADKKDIDNLPPRPYSDVNERLPEMTELQRVIVGALGQEPRLLDDVIAETGLNTAAVTSELTMLMIRGIVQRLPGNRIKLK